MKNRSRRLSSFFLLLSLVLLLLSACAPTKEPAPIALELTSLGTPYGELEARNPWDMIAYEGYLYLGAGDYDKNASPEVLMRLSLDSLTWEALTGYEDEQMERFLVIDGKLTLPGVDALEDWSYGNYYTVENDALVKHRVLEGGVHVFDMASHGGKTFAALGTENGASPLLVSEDGEHFSPLAFIESDGSEGLLSTPHYTLRIYDLLTLGERLYAIVTRYETAESEPVRLLYALEADGAMHFVSSLSEDISFVRLRYFPISGKVSRGDSLFFTTGKLYRTKDMLTFTDVTPKDTTYIADIVEAEGELYALGFTLMEDGITLLNNLYRYKEGEGFTLVAYFQSAVPPLSFTVVGNRFFVALNKMNGILDYHGEVYYGFLE